MTAPRHGRVLVVRPDNAGDVLLAGPAVRAVAAGSEHVTLLAGPRGESAARLLPGVDEVLCWRFPWIDPDGAVVDPADVASLVETLRGRRFDAALVLTSFHQSALPTALLLRLAGVAWVGAVSEDYPGTLLDLRQAPPGDVPEPHRGLLLAEAAGFTLPPGDDGLLAVRGPRRDPAAVLDRGDHADHRAARTLASGRYVVLHPGTSAPARAWPAARFAEAARELREHGRPVVVTGSAAECGLTAEVSAGGAIDLGGRTDLAGLADVLAAASVMVVGNTGPAHLAAAVGTPVVSLFAPTVPAERWAPYGVPHVLLGNQDAACRGSRATRCPVPGHPCLSTVTAEEVVRAVEKLEAETEVTA